MSAANLVGEERLGMTKSDVVKRGLLKLKASKVKGTVGESARGPKSSKPVFLVFRSLHSGDKFLHIYINEKKFHEAEKPKWEVLLKEASSVYFLSDKKSFCVSMVDGGLLFMDCSSAEDSEEWVRCLNAVLFAKSLRGDGILRYDVDMLPNNSFSHEGPSVLELSHCDLVIWDRQVTKEIVRWKLNHLRSFKAKNRTLTIITGSRSITGHKEFEFQSRHSVQITHTIETIVARVKYRSSPVMGTRNSQDNSTATSPAVAIAPGTRPLPLEPSLQSNIPNILDPIPSHEETFVSTSVMASVPNFTPAEFYENAESTEIIVNHGNHGQRAPGSLAFGAVSSSGPRRISPPRSLRIDSDAQYDEIDANTSKNSKSRFTAPAPRPKLSKNTFYESIGSPGKPDRKDVAPPRVPPSRELSHSPIANKKAIFHPDSNAMHPKSLDTYEKLEHNNASGPVITTVAEAEAQVHPEMYSSLLRVQPTGGAISVDDASYGELDYDKKAWESGKSVTGQFKHMTSVPVLSGANKKTSSYSQVDNKDCSSVKVEGYEVLQGDKNQRTSPAPGRRPQMNQPTEGQSYGRLSHGVSSVGSLLEGAVDRSKPAPNPKTARLLSPEGGVSKGFNPYDTMQSEKRHSTNSASSITSSALGDYDEVIEEESSTPIYSVATKRSERPSTRSRESCSTMQGSPPPGYESLGAFSNIAESSSKRSSSPELSPAVTPDRSVPAVPPRRRSKRRYENVGPNGEVLVEKSPEPDSDPSVEEGKMSTKPPVPAKGSKPIAKPRASSGTVASDGDDNVATSDGKPHVPQSSRAMPTTSDDTKPQVAPKPKVKPRPKYLDNPTKS